MTVYSLVDMPRFAADGVRNAARAEAAGLHRYMVAQVERADCVAVLAVVADRVPRIELATTVMAIQSTLPQYVAQQARTLNQISDGRFTLGLGASHEPIAVGMLGLEWDRPYRHMVEYLDAVLPLLADQRVDVDGTKVSHHTEIDVPGPAPRVMLAAMGPRMLALARDRTEGTVLAFTGPRTIENYVRPTIGEDALVSAAVGVCVTADVDDARRRIREELAIYPALPSYRAMVEREGIADMMDLVAVGRPDEVRAELARYATAGADEIGIEILGTPEETEQAWKMIEEGLD